MYCYFIDFTNYKGSEKELAKESEGYKYDKEIASINCFKLFTCHRIEFYSDYELPFLKDRGFMVLNDKQEIYNRLFSVTLGLKSQILFENAIINQVHESLGKYENDSNLLRLLSSSFIDAIEYRIKYNLFSENHGKFAMEFIGNKEFEKSNLIFIGSGALVQDSLDEGKSMFDNVYISSRLKYRQLKGTINKNNYVHPSELIDLCDQIEEYCLFIATTNIDEEYSNIINYISNKSNCKAIGNVTSVDFDLMIGSHVYYIDMYNYEMEKLISKSNTYFRYLIGKTDFYSCLPLNNN